MAITGLGRHGGKVDQFLGDEQLRMGLDQPGLRASSSALAWGPMKTPLPPDSAVGLTTS